MPVNFDLNLCIYPELSSIIFYTVVYYITKGYIARIDKINDLSHMSEFIFHQVQFLFTTSFKHL